MALPRSSSDNFNQQHYNGAGNNVANIKNPGVRRVVLENRQTAAANDAMRSANDEQHQSANPTIDEKFNASYQKQGLQPQGFRKVKKIDSPQPLNKKSNYSLPRNAVVRNRNTKSANDTTFADKKIARAKITAINLVLSSVMFVLWIAQLFIASINIIAFGLAGMVAAIAEAVGDNPVVKLITGAARYVAETASGAVEFIIGINLYEAIQAVNPTNIFTLTSFVLIAMALIQILVCSIIYKLFDIDPFLGKGAGLKIGAFILVLIGYSWPLLNLIPWINIWILTVWLKPK